MNKTVDQDRIREAMHLYGQLMEEIKSRLNVLQLVVPTTPVPVPNPFMREFCFLQLRMICELIALACLYVHGDIEKTNPMRGDFAADRIIKNLEKHHEYSFPISMKPDNDAPDRKFISPSDPYLTKEAFIKLVGVCGNELHRGSLKRLLKTDTPAGQDFTDIIDWTKKLIVLLNYHAILLHTHDQMILCIMSSAPMNGGVQIALLGKPPVS